MHSRSPRFLKRGQDDGNADLADYARRYNEAVIVIPICVDTTKFVPRPGRHRDNQEGRPTVGWIGNHSTARYLRTLLPILERVAGKHPFHLYVVGSPMPFHARGFEVTQPSGTWSGRWRTLGAATSASILFGTTTGVGASADLKPFSSWPAGVPVVVSAVGVNREIIQDGVNGFLAATEEQWVEKLGWPPLPDPSLREKLGRAGRETIVEQYSLAVHAPTMATVFRSALEAV